MECVVTAGPTYEPLDQVRRLTNFSTGRLGIELAGYLLENGHRVTLLLGEQATWKGPVRASAVKQFTSTLNLSEQLEALGRPESRIGAVFHAAAVNDFTFGALWRRREDGGLESKGAGKISTSETGLMVELIPAPKILASMRGWYPEGYLVGWKYEVEGTREEALARGREQLRGCGTDACVVNGPAYGQGFGLMTSMDRWEAKGERHELFEALGSLLAGR